MDRKGVPNPLLRKARQTRQETQYQTAQALGEHLGFPVEAEYISRLERGVVTWPHAHHRAALRAHFGVASDAELGFYCRRSASTPEEADTVKRRIFVGATPLALLPTGQPLAELISPDGGVPLPVPRRVGLEHLEQIRAMVTQADQLDHLFGGGFASELLTGQLRWAVSLLDAHVDRGISDQLHSAVGELAVGAAWSAHDAGNNNSAHRCHQVALHCAEWSDDWEIRAETLADMSRIAQYGGDGEAALTLAEQGLIRSDRLTPLRRAYLTGVLARAHGVRRDGEDCLAAIGQAEDLFAAADPAQEAPAMVAFYGTAQLAGDTGYALGYLGIHGQYTRQAIERLHRAVNSYDPGKVRARTLGLIRLASLNFVQGDPEHATAIAHDALHGAGSLHSHRVTDYLVELRRTAWRHRTVPGVARLRKRITATLHAA